MKARLAYIPRGKHLVYVWSMYNAPAMMTSLPQTFSHRYYFQRPVQGLEINLARSPITLCLILSLCVFLLYIFSYHVFPEKEVH